MMVRIRSLNQKYLKVRTKWNIMSFLNSLENLENGNIELKALGKDIRQLQKLIRKVER